MPAMHRVAGTAMFGIDVETVAFFAAAGVAGAADAGTSGASIRPNSAPAVNTVSFVILPVGKPTFYVGVAPATLIF